MEIGPPAGLLLGEDDGVVEEHLERSDLGENHVLVCVGVDVLVFSYFEGNQVGRDHVAYDFQVGVLLGDHLGY